jgi:hypothetical protein
MSLGYAAKAAAVAAAASLMALPTAPHAAPRTRAAEPVVTPYLAPSPTAARLAAWIIETGDNSGLPFVVVDKSAAVVSVYGTDGAELGSTPALIGQAIGDDSVPGIGDRPMSQILPEERTTPAGRFVAAYGPAFGGARTLWVDYATAISLHPVATGNPKERRTQRLKSPSPDDNRITYGCINVAAAFYKAVVHPTFAETKGVVYVLPDTRSLAEVFPSFGVRVLAEAAGGEGGR